MKSCCFTGHRNINENNQKMLLLRLVETIEECIHNGVTEFYSGGATGWDTLSAQTVLKLKRKYKNITLHLILPCNREDQTSKWNDIQRLEYDYILEMADSIEYTSNEYFNGCMKLRNANLIKKSDICICYFNHEDFRSGTGQTVRMALKKGIPIINLKF